MSVLGRILPRELPESLTYPNAAVPAVLAGAARAYGDRAALIDGDRSLTYTQLRQSAAAFAAALQRNGIGGGDVVALHLPNCIEFEVAYYGTLLAGATYSPTNPLLPEDDLAFQLNDCGARVVVCHDLSATTLHAIGTRCPADLVIQVGKQPIPGAVAFGDFATAGTDDGELDLALSAATPDDLAHISYTGGTTGRSKGVELTHRNVLSNIVQFIAWNHGAIPADPASPEQGFTQVGTAADWPVRLGTGVAINLTPWYHAMGCVGSLSVPVAAGVTLVLHDRFRPAEYLADAERYRVTALSGAPALYAALLANPDLERRNLSSVRNISSGAGPLPHSHIDALRTRFPGAVVTEGYGLTEATMGVSIGPTWTSGHGKPGTVGVPVFDTEIRLVDPESGQDVPSGERGEVLVRGPQVMRGYRNRPRDTAEVLHDGWLRTGDIGVLDTDGHLAVVDRSKDMLIYKGYNVYPREIEELLTARDGIYGAAVVGRPDAGVGEIPVAFVVPSPGVELDTDAVMREVNEQLLPYKRIKEVHIIDSLPISGAGKILKRSLRDRLESAAVER